MKINIISALGLIGLGVVSGCGGGSNNAVTTVPTAHLAITLPAGPAISGTPYSFTVSALDATNAVVPTYVGTVQITTSDKSATLPANATLARGTGTFTVTFGTLGSYTITASDTVGDATAGTSAAVSVGFTGFVSGPYRYTDLSIIDARSGPVVYDGAGSYSGGYVLNASGVISSGSISGPYTAAVSGAVTLGGYSGGVSADGNTIVSANLQAASAPSIDVEIKQGQTNFTNADFSGLYQVLSVSSFQDPGSSLTLSADGAGSYSGKLVQYNAGVITSSAVSGTYSVAADGALTITPVSGSPLSGGISADGRTLVLSQLTTGQPSTFAVGIKQGQINFTNADVLGTYFIVTYVGQYTEVATLNFDGAGKFAGTTTRNNGIINSTGTYTVAADGTLTVTYLYPCIPGNTCHGGTSEVFTGGVSSDGNTLVLSQPGPAAFYSLAASVGVRL